jgi:hypothetical protein
MTYPDNPAFARPGFYHDHFGSTYATPGITTREYFAAKAVQGLLTRNSGHGSTVLGISELQRIAQEAVLVADALIDELNKK